MTNPRFENPPVVERIIGLQFSEIEPYKNAHAGWFWKNYLDKEWTHLSEAPPIESRHEVFDGPRQVTMPRIEISTVISPARAQIVRSSDDRMIQLQNSRFLLNWRKKDGHDYPEYEELLREFLGNFGTFSDFVADAYETRLSLNQWEVTYVNHIPKGDLWDEIGDWHKIFDGFSLPGGDSSKKTPETVGLNWSINLADNIGRLHITIKHALVAKENREIIRLELTARGPIDRDGDFMSGIATGHDAIVNTFADITSKNAQEYWRRSS